MKFINTKRFSIVSMLASTFFAVSATSAEAAIDPNLETRLVKVCKALKSNDKFALQSAVKGSNISYSILAKGLKCNGKSALEFAEFHGSEKTANLLARKARLSERDMLAKR